MIRNSIIIFFYTLTINIVVTAQNVSIHGIISDNNTGEYLIGANVFDTLHHNGSITNKYGYYSISTGKGETVCLQFSFVGYPPVYINMNPLSDTTLNIRLLPGTNLSEVQVVSSLKEKLEHTLAISKVEIPLQQIKTLPSITGEPDILKAYQLMPGIQSGLEGNNGLYVRGGTPDQNLFLLDDVPLYNVSHLGGLFSVFDPSMVKSVELYKGGFPARYGGRVSSVVDIRNKDGDLFHHHGEVSFALLLSKIFLEGPIIKDKASYSISIRRCNLDLYSFLGNKLLHNPERIGYTFYDINVKTNYILSDRDRLFLSLYQGNDKFFYVLKEKVSAIDEEYEYLSKHYTRWGNTTASLRWYHVFNGKLFNNTTLAYTKYQYKNYNLFQKKDGSDKEAILRDEYQFISNVRDLIFKSDLEIPLGQHKFRTGAMFVAHFFNPGSVSYSQTYNIEQTDTVINAPEPNLELNACELAAYLEYTWALKAKLSGNIGIHIDYYNVDYKGFMSTEPRILINYRILHNISLKASYCIMQQNLHLLTNSNTGLPSDLWLPSTPLVEPEKSEQYAVALTHTTNKNYEFSIEAYYKKLSNLIEYKEGVLVYQSALNWDEKIETGGIGLVRGVELLIQKREGRLTGWVGYALSKNDRKFDHLNEGRYFPFSYDQRHEISLVVNYQLSDKLSLSGTWIYHSGHAVTLPVGKYQLTDYDYSGSNITDHSIMSDVHIYSEKNGFRMPDYHRLDFGLTYTTVKKRGIGKWSVGVYNAYNRQNAYYLFFKTKDGVTRLYQQSLFPFILNFGYSFLF